MSRHQFSTVEVINRRAFLNDGGTDTDIRRNRHTDQWHALGSGNYVVKQAYNALVVEDRHRLLIESYAGDMATGSILSHQSAAVLHGISMWNTPLDKIHVTREVRSGGQNGPNVYLHTSGRGPTLMTTIDGLPVTCASRTVVDLARTVPLEQGVVIADSALHQKLVTRDQLSYEAFLAQGRWGARKARLVLSLADERAESVGESRSRVLLARQGVPNIETQVAVDGVNGTVIARCDFAIRSLKICGEFDGRVKYGRLLRPGQEPGDAVFEEKRREDAIRDAGWQVVRWVWSELQHPEIIAARWQRAIRRRTMSRHTSGLV